MSTLWRASTDAWSECHVESLKNAVKVAPNAVTEKKNRLNVLKHVA